MYGILTITEEGTAVETTAVGAADVTETVIGTVTEEDATAADVADATVTETVIEIETVIGIMTEEDAATETTAADAADAIATEIATETATEIATKTVTKTVTETVTEIMVETAIMTVMEEAVVADMTIEMISISGNAVSGGNPKNALASLVRFFM